MLRYLYTGVLVNRDVLLYSIYYKTIVDLAVKYEIPELVKVAEEALAKERIGLGGLED